MFLEYKKQREHKIEKNINEREKRLRDTERVRSKEERVIHTNVRLRERACEKENNHCEGLGQI